MIAAVGSVGLFFANTVIFIGVAAMAGLAFECLVRKQYRRLTEVGCATAAMLVVSGAIYLILVRPQVTTILTNDWNPNYMPTHSVQPR